METTISWIKNHKKITAGIMLAVLIFGIVGYTLINNYIADDTDIETETVVDLGTLQLNYLAYLDDNYPQDDFTDEDWVEVKAIIITAQTAFGASLTIENLQTQYDYYIEILESYDSYSNIAEAFADYKDEATSTIAELYENKTYTTANQALLDEAIEDFETLLAECEHEEEVDSVVAEITSIIKAISSIESTATSSESMFSTAKSDAVFTITNYNSTIVYYEYEAGLIASLKESNINTIYSFNYTENGVELIANQVADTLAKIDVYSTRSEIDEEYVTELLEEIEATYDTADYYTTQVAEILVIIDDFNAAIEAITETEIGLVQLEMNALAETAIAEIEAVKTKDDVDSDTAQELVNYKETAIAEIEAYRIDDFTGDDVSVVTVYITLTKSDITNATTVEIVDSAVSAHKATVDNYLD